MWVTAALCFVWFVFLFWWRNTMRGLHFGCLWLLFLTQRIRAAINQSSLYNYKSKHLFCVLNSECNNPGSISPACPTTCSAAVVRMYKKTSVAVCECPKGAELWTMSPIVCASRSLTVWHWNNRCPNAGFLVQRGDVSVGPEPQLGRLIFIIMICYILLQFNSRLWFVCGPLEGELRLKSFGVINLPTYHNWWHWGLQRSWTWK